MSNIQLQAVDGDRFAVIALGAGMRGRDIVLDYVEDFGLVQIQCPMTEDGNAPDVCPDLCPIKDCEARDRRDRNSQQRRR